MVKYGHLRALRDSFIEELRCNKYLLSKFCGRHAKIIKIPFCDFAFEQAKTVGLCP